MKREGRAWPLDGSAGAATGDDAMIPKNKTKNDRLEAAELSN